MQDGLIARASLTTPIRCFFSSPTRCQNHLFGELCQDLGRSANAHRIGTTVFFMYFSYFICVVEYVSLACHWADLVSIVWPGFLILDKDLFVLWKAFHLCCWQLIFKIQSSFFCLVENSLMYPFTEASCSIGGQSRCTVVDGAQGHHFSRRKSSYKEAPPH